MRVLSWIKRTSALEPRGMIKSTSPSSLSNARLSSRDVSNSRACGETAEAAKPERRADRIAVQLRLASRPPLRMAPLPERIAKDAICITASGRASKITPRTPRGTLNRSSTKPESNSRCIWRTPTGSGSSATWRTPSIAPANFLASNFNRATRAGAKPSAAAASKSAALAATIWLASASRASAIAKTAWRRS